MGMRDSELPPRWSPASGSPDTALALGSEHYGEVCARFAQSWSDMGLSAKHMARRYGLQLRTAKALHAGQHLPQGPTLAAMAQDLGEAWLRSVFLPIERPVTDIEGRLLGLEADLARTRREIVDVLRESVPAGQAPTRQAPKGAARQGADALGAAAQRDGLGPDRPGAGLDLAGQGLGAPGAAAAPEGDAGPARGKRANGRVVVSFGALICLALTAWGLFAEGDEAARVFRARREAPRPGFSQQFRGAGSRGPGAAGQRVLRTRDLREV